MNRRTKTLDKWIDLADRAKMSADRAVRLLQVIKRDGDGQGMKVVRKETRILLRRAFLLWLRARVGI